jgi:hypothetical protein
MRGFSFVDDIQRRNRAERRLEEELTQQRARQNRQDKIAAEERAFVRGERQRVATERERRAEASRILADPNAPDELIEEFADIPEVSAYLAGRRTDAQTRADLEAAIQGEGPAPGTVSQGNQATQSPGGLAGQVEAAAVPESPLVTQPHMTQREIQEVSFTDPEQAAAIRDQQELEKAQKIESRNQARLAGLRPNERPPTPAEKAQAKKESERSIVESAWGAFGDANDPSGDSLRSLPAETLTSQYWEARSAIQDPEVLDNADRRMRPHIQETIQTQTQILTNPEINPNGLEARNATRKLSRAYGLANEIGVSYQPLRAAGVDARGLPIGTNAPLTDSVIASTQDAPGTPLPANPSTLRSDVTLVNRGARGQRVSERLAQAAFRLYKGGRIDLNSYSSLIKTGRLPAAAPEIKQFDPEKDTWAVYPDGRRVLIAPARKLDDSTIAGRNLISEEGLSQLNRIASAFDTGDDDARGTRMMNSFIGAIEQNEQRASALGYRLDNVNDVISLFNRWTNLHVVRDAYNDEWFADGRVNPDFTNVYGSLDDLLLNPDIDQQFIEDRNLRVPGTTTAGLGGQEPSVQDVRDRAPGFFDAARQSFPEFSNSSDEEIDAAFRAVGR